MRSNRMYFALPLALLLPAAAVSAADHISTAADKVYCQELSNTYVRYIGHDENYAHRRGYLRGSLDAQVAVAQCRQGNARAAIPVLEKKLTDQKFTLPVRG